MHLYLCILTFYLSIYCSYLPKNWPAITFQKHICLCSSLYLTSTVISVEPPVSVHMSAAIFDWPLSFDSSTCSTFGALRMPDELLRPFALTWYVGASWHKISLNSLRKLSFSHPYNNGFEQAELMPIMWHTAYETRICWFTGWCDK